MRKFEIRAPVRWAIGADRDRTGNLRVANAALSRLSYGPGAVTRSRLVALAGASGPAAAKQPPGEETYYSREGHVLQHREIHNDLRRLATAAATGPDKIRTCDLVLIRDAL